MANMSLKSSLPSSGRAQVKQILSSADTVILKGKPTKGPPPERLISFVYVSAPRLGTSKEKEEPYAFESKEFLRKLIVGKEVLFKIDYKATSGNREFGSLHLNPAHDQETSVTRILTKLGWVRVKHESSREPTSELAILLELEAEAQSQARGIWALESYQPRIVKQLVEGDPRDFLNAHKGQNIKAIVEQVRDGSSFRLLLFLKDQQQYINVSLAGIKAPSYRKDIPGMEDLIEPFGAEAKYFSESRLLQRDVTVVLEGLTNNNIFTGSITHPNGNISESLLLEGLAKIVDWNIAVVTGGPGKLRSAETKAKDQKLRLWKNPTAQPLQNNSPKDFIATVSRIINSDLILVQDSLGAERKITLSSVKVIKSKDPKDPAFAKDTHFNNEAREYLRSRLIGKSVNIDYIKLPTEGYSEVREYGTISLNGSNISESLVSRGLATVIRHRRDDDDRSAAYDALLIAEDRAIVQQKGQHSPKEITVVRITDASENVNKAKQFLPYLMRGGNIPAIVEFCATGGRFKVSVPSQSCKITLLLAGIRAPRVGRPGEKSDPFGPEALKFVNKLILQRDVEINIESADKVGGFIGSILTMFDGAKTNLAVALLSHGLVTLHEYSASMSPNQRDLFAAEQKGKDSRSGIWSIIDPSIMEKEIAAAAIKKSGSLLDEPLPTSLLHVVVSEIAENANIFIQVVNDDIKRLERLMIDFSLHHLKSSAASIKPKTGELCSAKFTADDNWYRARVRKANPDNTSTVCYFDFGNSETIPNSRIRPLDPAFELSMLPAQAVEARLSFTRIPEFSSDYGAEAFEHLRHLTENRKLQSIFLGKDRDGVTNVILIDPTDDSVGSVQERMIRDGWSVVEKAAKSRHENDSRAKSMNHGAATSLFQVVGTLLDAESRAKVERLNLWRYGDFEGDED